MAVKLHVVSEPNTCPAERLTILCNHDHDNLSLIIDKSPKLDSLALLFFGSLHRIPLRRSGCALISLVYLAMHFLS